MAETSVMRTDERTSYVPLIVTVGLMKCFTTVLTNDNIDFDVRRGEIHCLLGETVPAQWPDYTHIP